MLEFQSASKPRQNDPEPLAPEPPRQEPPPDEPPQNEPPPGDPPRDDPPGGAPPDQLKSRKGALPEPTQPEPWMRGPIPGIDPLLAPILYSFQQAREDLALWTEGLTPAELWSAPHGFGSVGFHLRHIAGSTDRLMTYLIGDQLDAEQLAFMKSEHNAGASRDELLSALNEAFLKAEAVIRSLDPTKLAEARGVGRKRLPTTVIGLLIHIAEHTQRHVGQAISAAKWTRIV